jgi:hypothetical protein
LAERFLQRFSRFRGVIAKAFRIPGRSLSVYLAFLWELFFHIPPLVDLAALKFTTTHALPNCEKSTGLPNCCLANFCAREEDWVNVMSS